ncbi:hypothetical protein K474DRAFT_45587 [Panus rudis PR-1116 ss-1]|nr:hypothetical protein K474DRAFT_45587 [Panus rudis PR-1116 ss-1]
MATSSEEDTHRPSSSKKRRVHKACDTCRQKKIRCGGSASSGMKCPYCASHEYDCSFSSYKKRITKTTTYVENLERRMEKLERLIQQLRPDLDLSEELGEFTKESWDRAAYAPSPPAGDQTRASSSADEEPPPSDDEMAVQATLMNSLKYLRINPAITRYVGKSSNAMLIQKAMEAKSVFSGDGNPPERRSARRPEFWITHPWVRQQLHSEIIIDDSDFPSEDLMKDLIELYFKHINDLFPLLHRPTLESQIADGLHRRCEGFGSVLLLVCAIGSQYSDDPRVLLEGYDSKHSAGWKFFIKVPLMYKSLLTLPRLHDLQTYALACLYLQGTCLTHGCWNIIGIAARMAEDVGAHRRKVYAGVATVENELWKRAFWVITHIDRAVSMNFGRLYAVREEDIDLELPEECDDEYWAVTGNTLKFKQPKGKPSKIAFFNTLLRMDQIIVVLLRTIYASSKSRTLLGLTGPQWAQKLVVELDSWLNKCVDQFPQHLRWDPNRKDRLFMSQSALLHAYYYALQISIHRSFIPKPGQPPTVSFPSLAICTNAARAFTHVMYHAFVRFGFTTFRVPPVIFTVSIVLLLNIWSGKKSGLRPEDDKSSKDLECIHRCLEILTAMEDRCYSAGRVR